MLPQPVSSGFFKKIEDGGVRLRVMLKDSRIGRVRGKVEFQVATPTSFLRGSARLTKRVVQRRAKLADCQVPSAALVLLEATLEMVTSKGGLGAESTIAPILCAASSPTNRADVLRTPLPEPAT